MLDAERSILEPAGDSDIPSLARLWNQAFPGSRSVAERERGLSEGEDTYGGLDDVRVARVDGRMAGALRIYRMRVHVWGRVYPAMGLGAVAVAPDFRRRGVGSRMCTEALRESRARGDVLSMLYPFRVSYYRRLGYTLAGELHRYRFSPYELHPFPGEGAVVWGSAADEDEVRAVYRRVAARSNGLIERDEPAWRFLDDPDRLVFLFRPDGGEATGYLVARPRKRKEGAELRVRELMAEDREAYEGLLGWIAAQGDQWKLVTYDAMPSEAFHRNLAHPRRPRTGRRRRLWFESGGILRGPMLRIVDAGRVLADASVSEVAPLRIEDGQLSSNHGLWETGDEPRRVAEGDGNPGVEVRSLGIAEAADLFVRGVLGSRAPHPEGWEPAMGIADFRLLDEF